MYGLTGIVLQDSYLRNKLVRFDARGHTNISGGNGAGKTSILNLQPFFFGAEPSLLSTRAGGKLPFVDYYLPTQSSFIIFEYTREDGPHCVLVYRHSSGLKPAYRFIQGAFEKTLFAQKIDGQTLSVMTVSNLLGRLQAGGIQVSHQIETVREYRAIIQHDKKLLRDGNKAIRRLARQYCIGGENCHMAHMEKVTHAVLKRSKMFERLKEMTGSMLEEASTFVPSVPDHVENRYIGDDLYSLRDFNKHQSNLRKTIADHEESQQVVAELHTLARTLNKLEVLLKDKQQALNKDLQVARDAVASTTNERDKTRDVIELCRSDFRRDICTGEQLIERLHEQKSAWENDDIVNKQQKLRQLQQFEQQLDSARQHWEQLSAEIADIQGQKERCQREAADQHNEVMEGFNERKQEIKDLRLEAKEQHMVDISTLNQQQSRVLRELNDSVSNESDKLQRDLGNAEGMARQVQTTEAEDQQLAAADDNVSRVEDEEEILTAKINRLREQFSASSQEREKALKALERTDKEIKYSQQAIDGLIQQLNPADGTLLAALKQQDSDWGDTLGRVIQPELLLRRDLAPYKVTSSDSLYGWQIDLEVLDTPSQARSDAQLQEALHSEESQLRTLREDRDKQAKRLGSLNEKNNQHRDELEKFERLATRLQNKRREIAGNRKALLEQINQAKQERREQAALLVKDIEQKIKDFNSHLQRQQQEIEQRYTQEIQELNGSWAITESDFEQRLSTNQADQQRQQKNHQLRLKELEVVFTNQCREQGVDDVIISRAEQAFLQAKKTVKEVINYRSQVDDYQRWLRSDWSTLEQKSQQLLAEREQLTSKDAESRRHEEHYKTLLSKLRSNQQGLQGRLITTNDELVQIDNAMKRVADVPEQGPMLPMNTPVSDLLTELDAALNKQRQLNGHIDQGVKHVNNIIRERPKSKINEAWESLLHAHARSLGVDLLDPKMQDDIPIVLKTLLDDSLPQIQAALIEKIRAVGQQLADFYSGLGRVREDIHGQSRRLGSKMNANQRIESLSDIEIKLESRVEQEEYWQELSKFYQDWQRWNSLEEDDPLPPEHMAESLTNAISALKGARVAPNLKSLIDLVITLKENGSLRVIRNDADLDEASSNGLSYLAICIIFMGVTRYLCPDKNISIHWPIDELASLDHNNITRLFAMLDEEHISMFSAFPSVDTNLLQHFDSRQLIDRKDGVRRMVQRQADIATRLLDARYSAPESVEAVL